MSEGNYQDSSARQKRVQRLKKIIIYTLIISILIPIVACIVLFVRVHTLNVKLDEMANQIENLANISLQQQELLQQWLEDIAIEGGGEAAVGQAEPVSVDISNLADSKSELRESSEAQWQGMRKVYLTFDDGPGKYTEDILAILERYDVKATFFVVGKEGEEAEAAMRDIVAAGHTLGLHSYSHKYNEIYKSVEAFAEDFTHLQDYVREVTGVESKFYRFPGGSSNTVSDLGMGRFAEYLESCGVEYFDWNISSGDGSSILLDVQTIVENCLSNIEDYDNVMILMHDSADKPTTVEALPIIIENILALEDTVILPITEDTEPVQHIDTQSKE